MTLLQQRIDASELESNNLQLELTSVKEELEIAHQDVKRYSEDATQTQELYQRELLQHSKSVESLHEIKDKVCCIRTYRTGAIQSNMHVCWVHIVKGDTAEPLFCGHPWDSRKFPDYQDVHVSGVVYILLGPLQQCPD